MTWWESLIAMQDRYIGNIAALILVSMLIAANYRKMKDRRKDFRILIHLLGNLGLYSVIEMLSCALEGGHGSTFRLFMYLLNAALFVINMELGYGWVRFIAIHLGYEIPKRTQTALLAAMMSGIALLIINFYQPLIFTIDQNGYYGRSTYYFIFMIIAELYFAYSIYIYIVCRVNGGILKYFPVWLYIVPSIVGILIEWLLDSSIMSVCNASAICAVLASLQQEEIFRDRLTGLYNRAYLEELRIKLEKAKNSFASGIMLDLNGFKGINDSFGHAEGDQALIIASDLISKAVGSYGDVIRYAGDEFVVILNTWDTEKIKSYTRQIRELFENFNEKEEKPYHLTVSMGYATFNAETQTVNEFLNTIDKNMYENKKSYYEDQGIDRRECKIKRIR